MHAFVQAGSPARHARSLHDRLILLELNSAQGLLLGEISLILPGCWSLLRLGPRPCGTLFTSDLA